MRIYAIRESWQYECYDLIEFFASRVIAEARAAELNAAKSEYYDDYTVEEHEVRDL